MRRSLLLSVLALLAGLGVGVVYSWMVSPMRYVDTTPNTLRSDFKDSFRSAIAAAYAATHNLDRARARLLLLGDSHPVDTLAGQAQRMLAAGEPFQAVQAVAELATDLQTGLAANAPSPVPPPVASKTATPTAPASPSPAATEPAGMDLAATPTEAVTATLAFPTPTARPTRTPIPTASMPFQLVSETEVCNPNLTDGLLQISVLDSHRHQMPGVEINITWSSGEESFFTGMKPEIADGYADYVMQAGMSYAVRVERSGTPVSGLTAPSCPGSDNQTYMGGLKLVFQQP